MVTVLYSIGIQLQAATELYAGGGNYEASCTIKSCMFIITKCCNTSAKFSKLYCPYNRVIYRMMDYTQLTVIHLKVASVYFV